VEEKKNSETMKKELEALQKKARVIDSSLKTAQNDLEAFQVCCVLFYLFIFVIVITNVCFLLY
jgi:hypothetical protein